MKRWVLVFVVACGGHSREVSKIKYTHVQCSDCGIEGNKERFEPPDAERTPPPAHEHDPSFVAKPGEPTCRLVAETLVSLELGNYAEPEERAPKIAAEEKRCIAMKLARDDRQCVVDSYDKTSVAYCVPAYFPTEPSQAVSSEQCATAANAMRNQFLAQIKAQQIKDSPSLQRQLAAAIESCSADRWNAQMLNCAMYSLPLYPQNCAWMQPYAMYKRITARLEKAK